MTHDTDPAKHQVPDWTLFSLPDTAVVDPEGRAAHLNGDTLDNRLANLTYVITCSECDVTFGVKPNPGKR